MAGRDHILETVSQYCFNSEICFNFYLQRHSQAAPGTADSENGDLVWKCENCLGRRSDDDEVRLYFVWKEECLVNKDGGNAIVED